MKKNYNSNTALITVEVFAFSFAISLLLLKKAILRSIFFISFLVFSKMGITQNPSVEIIGTSVPPYNWSAGVSMSTSDGTMYTLSNYELKSGEAKFRQDASWTVNWGANTFPEGTGYQDGPNIPVNPGIYNISFNRLTGVYNFQCVQCEYCTTGLYDPTSNCLYGHAINDFTLSNVHHTGTGCNGELADYTSLTINLARGESYMYTLSSTTDIGNTSYDFVGIWIDFNDNKSFGDEGELVFTSSSGGIFSGFLSIPATAPLGNHRMRVRLKADYSLTPFSLYNSCTYYYNGEAHDYTVNISTPPSCTGLSSLSVSEIKKLSATVNFGCGNCSGPFIVEYGTPGFTPGTGSSAGSGGTIVNTASSPVILNGLTSDSEYEVYVRRSCGDNNYSLNFGPIKFRTKYDACGTLQTITCNQVINAVVTTGKGEYDYYPNMGVGYEGKEKIYQFTPTATGKYVISVTNTNNVYANYLIKDASLGCNRYYWKQKGGVYSAPAMIYLDTLTAGKTYYLMLETQGNWETIQEYKIECASVFNPCSSITNVTCANPTDYFTIPEGPGAYDNNVNQYYSFIGKEKIFSYTPASSGKIRIKLTPPPETWSQGVGVFIKNASGGCNENNWVFLGQSGGFSSYYPFFSDGFEVVSGNTYYIMVDANYLSGLSAISMEVTCPEVYDPCATITQVTCGVPVEANIPAGLGKYDTVGTGCGYNPTLGKELIYSFTPLQTGRYVFNISIGNYQFVKYMIKEAGDCDENNWICMGGFLSGGKFLTPISLSAEHTYYILLDAGDVSNPTPTSFTIDCAVPLDICSSIANVGCGQPIDINIPGGPGIFNPTIGYYSQVSGNGMIMQFTPATTGTYFLKVTDHTGPGSIYGIKPASDGCTINNWVLIPQNYYVNTHLVPMQLTAGTSYFIYAGSPYGSYYSENVSEKMEIICPNYSFDPCASLSTIEGCNTIITSTIDAGVGNFVANSSFTTWGSGINGPAGKEKIFRFTPSVTGRYVLNPISGTGEMSFAIKETSGGCNSSGWNNIGSAGAYSGYYKTPIPVQLVAGTSYDILTDAHDTTGASVTFQLLCPENYDPCQNIRSISCGSGNINVPTVGGYGNYFEPSCGDPIPPAGKPVIYEFTAEMNGTYLIEAITGQSFVGYIKKSSLGCGPEGWTCIGNTQRYVNDWFTPELNKGEKYLLMIIPGYDYGDFPNGGLLSLVLHCNTNCTIYADEDGDGYGDPGRSFPECWRIEIPEGYSANNFDCNDHNPAVHPGATEICGNGIDDDCDGLIDEDCGCTLTMTCPPDANRNTIFLTCSSLYNTPKPVIGGTCILKKLTWVMTGATSGASPVTGINYVGTKLFKTGVTTIIYTASDALGKSVSCSFTVTVNDNVNPVLICPSDIKQDASKNSCSKVINVSNPMAFDNCGLTNLTWVMTGATSGNSPATGINYVGKKTFNAGTTTITYTAKDTAGNISTCSFKVKVNSSSKCNVQGTANKTGKQLMPEDEIYNVAGELALKVFPNPSNDYFNMEMVSGNPNQKLDITLFDITGRLLKKIVTEPFGVAKFGENLIPGVYVVEVKQGESRKMIKLVKQ